MCREKKDNNFRHHSSWTHRANLLANLFCGRCLFSQGGGTAEGINACWGLILRKKCMQAVWSVTQRLWNIVDSEKHEIERESSHGSSMLSLAGRCGTVHIPAYISTFCPLPLCLKCNFYTLSLFHFFFLLENAKWGICWKCVEWAVLTWGMRLDNLFWQYIKRISWLTGQGISHSQNAGDINMEKSTIHWTAKWWQAHNNISQTVLHGMDIAMH